MTVNVRTVHTIMIMHITKLLSLGKASSVSRSQHHKDVRQACSYLAITHPVVSLLTFNVTCFIWYMTDAFLRLFQVKKAYNI